MFPAPRHTRRRTFRVTRSLRHIADTSRRVPRRIRRRIFALRGCQFRTSRSASIASDQPGNSGNEYRAKNPSRHDLQPQIVLHDRTANPEPSPEDHAIAGGGAIWPKIRFLVKIHERQEDVQGVEKRMQFRVVSLPRGGWVLRPGRPHHAGSLADSDNRPSHHDHSEHPEHREQRPMAIAYGSLQKSAQYCPSPSILPVSLVLAGDKNAPRSNLVAALP